MNLLIEHLGWTLLHSLWQGALLAAAVQLAWPFLGRHSARARYNLACLALALFALAPVLTFCGLAATERPVPPVASGASPSVPASTASVTLGLAPGPSPVPFSVSVVLRPALPWLVGLWLLGAGCSVLRLALAWRRVRRLAGSISEPLPDAVNARLIQLAARLGIRRAVRAGLSAAVTVPTVIGWARPVILVPVALLAGLSPVQLDALLAHELAHIRRHDFLVNVLQTVCEALFFYHPAIYALNRRIRAERENACDDIAVGVTGNAVDYARALASLEATRPDALALAATGDGELLARVRRLIGLAPTDGSRLLRITKVLLAWIGLGAATLIVLVVGLRPKVYQAETTMQMLRPAGAGLSVGRSIIPDEVVNTVVKMLESSMILRKVSDRLTGDELHRFMAPYEKGPGGASPTPIEILGQNRFIIPVRLSLLVKVVYRHPDRLIAAKVANYFAEEYISYLLHNRIEEQLKVIDPLRSQAKDQAKKVEDLTAAFQAFHEGRGGDWPKLNERRDAITSRLRSLSRILLVSQTKLKDAEDRWQEVKSVVDANGDLLALPYIGSAPLIAALAKNIAAKKAAVTQLGSSVKADDPAMISATRDLAQVEAELLKATINSVAAIEIAYKDAENAETVVQRDLDSAKADSFALDKDIVAETETLAKDLESNQKILTETTVRIEAAKKLQPDGLRIRIIDVAHPPAEGDYASWRPPH